MYNLIFRSHRLNVREVEPTVPLSDGVPLTAVTLYNLLPLGLFNTVLGLLATSLDQAYSQHIPIFTAS